MSVGRRVFLALLVAVVIELCYSKHRNYDNFDIESLLAQPLRSRRFFECIRNDTSCTKEDKEMKHDLVEMITTSCAGCTDKEKSKLQNIKRRALEDPHILTLAFGDN